MAFKPGHLVHILLDNVAGSPVNISAYSDAFSFPNPTETVEVSVHGTNSKAFIPGLTGGGAPSMSGPLDVALGTFVAAVQAAQAAGSSSCTLTYSPGGSVAGQFKRSAEVYVTGFDVQSGVGGRVEYSCSLQVTGATVDSTW